MFSQLRLLKYVRPHWRHLTAMLLTMGVGIGLEVLRPWPTKLLVDQVLGGQPMSAISSQILQWLPGPGGVQGLLMWVCISTVLIFVMGTLMTTISTLASVQLGQSMTYDLGADLFLHVQRLSLLFHSRRSVGDTLSRVTGDAYCVQSLVTGAIVPLIRSTGTLIAMFAVMWKLQPWMTLMSLGVAPFMLLSIRMFGKSMKQRTRERRDLEGQMTAVVQRALSAIPVVQAFSREEVEYDRFRSCAGKTIAAYRRGTMAGMWFRFSVGLVTAVGTAGIMWLGAHYALQGSISIGTILVFLAYLASLYAPLTEIAYTASTWQGAAASSERVIEVLTTEPKVKDSPEACDVRFIGHVQYEGVSFGYDDGRPVLEDITFEARPGEVIAIVGPTGAGKTTLVNLLVRFFDPSSGRILIDGHDLRDLKVKCIRNQVAMVLQEPFIFPLTAAENIAYGRLGATREEIVQAAIAAEADAFIRKLPEGYDSIIGERGATLSGGEKQRLSIARAFLKNAPILVLDEPTSALDARTESLLLGAMSRLMRSRTTFIIAHRLSTIRSASRILVLDAGRIVEQGRHSELLARGGLYSSLYRQQMEIARHDVRPEPAHLEAVV